MYLDEIVAAQERGKVKGITSICSAHPWVLKTAMRENTGSLLIEATCNQVNQFGGYTGMRPTDFARYVRGIAEENQFPFENVILGGDHLGPGVWQNEPEGSAMQESAKMVKDYVQAGFEKIHLDCSMQLGDDPNCALDIEISAKRAAQLAKVAEEVFSRFPRGSGGGGPRYIIGTEVPVPGGAHQHEETVSVTKVEDARQTIEVTREAFLKAGLASAWERVIGVVVQPGVEFGDDFVFEYQPEKAKELSRFMEGQSMIYEAHSTDYQTPDALRYLVRDHFAILKVGPALTFAFREAVFALAKIEHELFAKDKHSNIIQVLDDVMVRHPQHWNRYYRGTDAEQAFKRKYSYSDRARYYWVQPEVQKAFEKMMGNLGERPISNSLLNQFVGEAMDLNAREVIESKIRRVLRNYQNATEFRFDPLPQHQRKNRPGHRWNHR